MLLDGGGKGRKTQSGRQMMLGGCFQSSELHRIAIQLAVLIFSEIPRERTSRQHSVQGFMDNFLITITLITQVHETRPVDGQQ